MASWPLRWTIFVSFVFQEHAIEVPKALPRQSDLVQSTHGQVNHAIAPVEPPRGSPCTPCFKHTADGPPPTPRQSERLPAGIAQLSHAMLCGSASLRFGSEGGLRAFSVTLCLCGGLDIVPRTNNGAYIGRGEDY